MKMKSTNTNARIATAGATQKKPRQLKEKATNLFQFQVGSIIRTKEGYEFLELILTRLKKSAAGTSPASGSNEE